MLAANSSSSRAPPCATAVTLRRRSSAAARQPGRRGRASGRANSTARGGASRPCTVARAAVDERSPSGQGDAGLSPREEGLQAYAALKWDLIRNNAQFGGLVALYLGLTQHDPVAFTSAAIGVAGSVAYLALLSRYVDGLTPQTVRAIPKSGKRGGSKKGAVAAPPDLGALLKTAATRVGDVYSNGLLKPQMAVPVALAAGCSAWNAADLGPNLFLFDVFIGFFTYKAVVLDQGWTALKRVMREEATAPPRPTLPLLGDEEEELQ